MSAAAVNGYDDSAATLAAGESDETDNLTLLSNTPKAAPFETEADFNSDLAFENGYAFGGNNDRVQIWDVRDGQTALASFIHCPGLAERRHGQRRDPRHVDRLAPHQ
jgi:WD40 repeat protein